MISISFFQTYLVNGYQCINLISCFIVLILLYINNLHFLNTLDELRFVFFLLFFFTRALPSWTRQGLAPGPQLKPNLSTLRFGWVSQNLLQSQLRFDCKKQSEKTAKLCFKVFFFRFLIFYFGFST